MNIQNQQKAVTDVLMPSVVLTEEDRRTFFQFPIRKVAVSDLVPRPSDFIHRPGSGQSGRRGNHFIRDPAGEGAALAREQRG